jgi:stage III sporulation protein AG
VPGEKTGRSYWDYFKDLWKGVQGGRKKNIFLLTLLILGIILMFAGSLLSPQKKPTVSYDEIPAETRREPVASGSKYEEELIQSLQHVLESIDGISRVQIFINFDNTGESFYARVNEESNRRTTEQDREGGTREILETTSKEDYVLLREEGGGEKPLLLSDNMPEIKGILIVAGGVKNSSLRLKVVRAIQSVLNLPVHKIAVLPLGESKAR